MHLRKISSFISSKLLWILLYGTYVLIYQLFLGKYDKDTSYFNQSVFVGLLPLMLLGLAIAAENIYPYKSEWRKIDMNSINNVLFMFINDYGDASGKSLALLVVVKMKLWTSVDNISGLWPSAMPIFLQVLIGLMLYDFVYYWYHRISHSTNFLWRLHRLHHSSERLTTIAVFKFNILDIIIELFLLTLVMKVAGVPDKVFLIMAGFMVPATLLSHANFSANIPDWIGWMVINPDNHRIHHANESMYYNKNFGGFTLFWDLVFGTYQAGQSVEVNRVGIEGRKTSKWMWWQFFDFLKP